MNETTETLAEVLGRFIAACDRIHAIAERCRDAMPKPHGCICPPGSEGTCQGIACPRRPWRMGA